MTESTTSNGAGVGRFSSLLGFVLQGNPRLQLDILSSTVSQFPVIGAQLRSTGLRGSGVGVVVGLLGSLYGVLGVAQAVQNLMNVAWAVPRNRRPNPILARVRSVLLLATAGVAVIATTILSALGTAAESFGATSLGWGVKALLMLVSISVNAGVFLLAFRIATVRQVGWRQSVPGALSAAVAWQVLQVFGALLVGNVLKNATALNGVFGLVLGLVAWLYATAVAIALSVELNVVLAKRLWPRALLTPFTDDVNLTHGDRRSYTDAAKAQRVKGFETVDVSFHNDGQNAGREGGSTKDPAAS
ncbi:YihY/virulence factor BrkB family protein [Pedococcus sp. KACC 23699]|uniref:YihY/virulence factor BrkB family protein n=1 Tax=Pedococcus sp. KACC 23699 TaxID=3149228 RepID=A0AAU7JSL4_9MICO